MRVKPSAKFSAAILIFLLLAACAKKPPSETVRSYYYPACHEPLAYLQQRSQSHATGRAIAGGAVQGGVISGIAGIIISAIAGGSVRPGAVLASIGVGSAIGGATSAASGMSNATREDNKHLAAYLEQIDGDIEGLDIVKAAATVSNQCYAREFRLLLTQMQSMPENAAKNRLREITAGREEASQLLGVNPEIAEYQHEFDLAANKDYGKAR